MDKFFDKIFRRKSVSDKHLAYLVHVDCEVDKSGFDHMLNLYNKKRCTCCNGTGFV